MTEETKYIIEDTRWLLSFGRPPLEIAKQLNRAPSTIYEMSLEHKLEDIKAAFRPYSKAKRS